MQTCVMPGWERLDLSSIVLYATAQSRATAHGVFFRSTCRLAWHHPLITQVGRHEMGGATLLLLLQPAAAIVLSGAQQMQWLHSSRGQGGCFAMCAAADKLRPPCRQPPIVNHC